MALQFQLLGSKTQDVRGEFQILLFGATPTGQSVSCAVTGFRPFFFIELRPDWSPATRKRYERYIRESANDQRELLAFSVEHHCSMWDFTNNLPLTFLRVTAPTSRLWRAACDAVLDRETATPIPVPCQRLGLKSGTTVTLRVFEANIDPMLRFFHCREIPPAGWVTIEPEQWTDDESASTTTELQVTVDWDRISPAPPAIQLTSAPLRVLSWDIECTSSHGDFPLAEKTWRKPVRELVEAGLLDNMVETLSTAVMKRPGPISPVYVESPEATVAALATITADMCADALKGPAETLMDRLDALLMDVAGGSLGPEGDPIIQIGSVVYVNGVATHKEIFVLGSCSALPPPTVTHACASEAQLIRKWCAFLRRVDPDVMIGFNISGFDNKYIWDRAVINRCTADLAVFSRMVCGGKSKDGTLVRKELSSSAMGNNVFHFIQGTGRLHVDLMTYVKRNSTMEFYNLDYVTATFMSGPVTGVGDINGDKGDGTVVLRTKSTKGTIPGRSIVVMDDENDVIGEKLEVVAVEPKALRVAGGAALLAALADHGAPATRWSQSKDDISPKDIFRLHREGPVGRARIAKYCIQDCDLVVELFQKLEVLNNSIAMANVCWVPVEFIFTRGQGIKAESLMFYECRKEGLLIPVLPAPKQEGDEVPEGGDPELLEGDEDNEKYEGAIVLEPLTGIYLDDDPVAALDFSSLYPSTIISENISYDSLVWVKDYALDGTTLVRTKEGSDTYDNLEGWDYLDIAYDILKPDPADKRKEPALVRTGRRVCRYAQSRDPSAKSILPKILQKLLKQRKATRKLAETESDDFRKALLDALQLAYKLTANSIYGQLGSNTSKIRRKVLAASTTAHGRDQLLFSKASIEAAYGPAAGDPRCAAVVVYGDTDSVFIAFRPRDPVTGERLRGRAAQAAAKALAEEAGAAISGALKAPHDFEFDKMFRCFCLLSKKRYVGDMTEGGLEDEDYHRKSMGIAMKRRGNAPIVKYIFGGAIERILKQQNIRAAFEFVRGAARELLAGVFSIKRLLITKSLRAEYKAPYPAHKVLADRIGKRDPGNKPSSNDRIPFIYVATPRGQPEPTTQGDRIELPSYVVEHGLKPDYAFYLTNQVANPVAQMFAIVVEQLPGFRPSLVTSSRKRDPVAVREEVAIELLFGDLLRDYRREASGQRDIRSMFGCSSKK